MQLKFIMFELLSKTYLLILFKSCKKLQTCIKLGTLGLIFKYNMYTSKNEKYQHQNARHTQWYPVHLNLLFSSRSPKHLF